MRHVTILLAGAIALATSAQNDHDATIVDYVGLRYPCNGDVVPTLRIQNVGTVTMNTCVVETWKNGVFLSSFNWVLTVPAPTGAVRQPSLPTVSGMAQDDTLEFRIIDVNSVPDQDPAGNIRQVPLDVTPDLAGNSTLLVEVITDAQPGETSWTLRNAAGQVLAQGGSYTVPFEVDSVWVTTPPGECLMLRVNDAGGDGMDGSVRVHDAGGIVSEVDGATFAGTVERGIVSGTVTSLETDGAPAFSVAPVPAMDRVTVRFSNVALVVDRIELLDAMGRSVRTWPLGPSGNGEHVLDLSGVPDGVHFLHLRSTAAGAHVVRMVVAH